MNKTYVSTRNHQDQINFYQAIVQGIGDDGGLLVPNFDFQKLDLNKLVQLNYVDLATEVISTFVPEDGKELIHQACLNAYGKGLFPEIVVPVKKAGDVYVAELFHGQTAAFKDMALSLLPHLMTLSLKQLKEDREVMILAATSGDTGKAALEGFKDVEGTSIKVFYPLDGVSAIQQQQMVSQEGKNVKVVGIHGNFDDAQTGVKEMFHSKNLAERMNAKGYQFSSANSINIGRLVPQIVYYVYAYGQLLKQGEITCGEKINVVVPTGNFGNILAAFYAKNMGLPIETLYCASNENKVLFDFFQSGTYDRKREFILTSSPSMDILISSNLERLIYRITGEDAAQTKVFMDALSNNGEYTITKEMMEKLSCFVGGYASEAETAANIKKVFDKAGYIMDTHTSVASCVYYDKAKDAGLKTVIASTASPYKFTRSVMDAIDKEKYDSMTDFELVDELNALSGVKIPEAIEEIRTAPIRHDIVCDKSEMQMTVEKILGL